MLRPPTRDEMWAAWDQAYAQLRAVEDLRVTADAGGPPEEERRLVAALGAIERELSRLGMERPPCSGH